MVHITLPANSWVLNFFFDGEFTHHHSTDHLLTTAHLVTPHIISNSAIQETITFSLILVQYFLTKLRIVFSLFLYEHLWDLLGINFAVFHCCQHQFQHIETNIQLHSQFSGHNQLIHGDEVIEMLFILWSDSCAWLSGIWLVYHVNITTAKTHHPSPHCAHVHCLVSINVQQDSMNIFGCYFFHMEEFSSKHLHSYFHVRCHSVRLSLCCHLSYSNKM